MPLHGIIPGQRGGRGAVGLLILVMRKVSNTAGTVAPVSAHRTMGEVPINLGSLGRVRVLEALAGSQGLTRAELVRRTGLARATVGSVVYDLIGAGIVQETIGSSVTGSRTGRPPQLLSIVPSAAYAVGLDIGHDHVRAILTDVVGTSRWDETRQLAVDGDPNRALDVAVDLIDRAVAATGVHRSEILGVGIGIACPLDASSDTLYADGIMPGWVGVRPGAELTARSGLTAWIINDADAGVLAECRFGAARDCADVIYLRLASGIGAGVISDGRMLGQHGLAAELGHLPIEPGGALCRCGNRGCLETVASPTAIAALLSRSWGRPVSPADLTDLLRTDDRGAHRAVADAGDAVGRVLAIAVTLVNPELIVVGGDLATAGEVLFGPMRRALDRHTMSAHTRTLRIVPSALGDSACVRGAAALVLDSAPGRLGGGTSAA
jgi:predicted NBD/HSP70 family sugar kinase